MCLLMLRPLEPTAADYLIRPYQSQDRQAVRRIAYATAFFGNSAKAFFDGEQFLEDSLTSYYLDYEPESCFVAESQGKVIGYLIGSRDYRALEKRSQGKVLSGLFAQLIFQGVIFKKKNFIFMLKLLRSFLRGELNVPDFSGRYPACLHINLAEGFRNFGIGRRLMETFLDYLSRQGVKGVHLATFSEDAGRFYQRMGFILLHTEKRSYFDHLLTKEVFCYTYGKKI